jgi:hypothetical protein
MIMRVSDAPGRYAPGVSEWRLLSWWPGNDPSHREAVMSEPVITCPNCHSQNKLTESLAAPLIEAARKGYEERFAEKDAAVAQREATVRDQLAQIVKERQSIEADVTTRLDAERKRIAGEENEKARRLVETDVRQKDQQLAELGRVLQQREEKLAEAQKAQADLIRKERELDDARREIELTVEKQVRASLLAVRETAKREAEESLTLKVREKEEQIAGMQRQIEELRRKAEQGSQQLQGEVQELELQRLLSEHFSFDQIEAVPKGEFGGDVIQYVMNSAGQRCGAILWETKRTKNWSDGWLAKLREDQRSAKADIALIVSQALPKGLNTFDLVDGVWVSEPRCAMAVAMALRESLIAVAKARIAGEGQQTKTEMVYQYLTGPRFRHRVEAIVEKFVEMQSDLDRERKTMTRLWAKREEQIRGVIESTAGMYGDLQGIAGRTLQEIEGLQIPLIESSTGSG